MSKTTIKPKTRTRVRMRHIMEGTNVRTSWTIECLLNRKWLPLHGEKGIDKFESKDAAEIRAKELEQLDFSK